MSGAPANPAPAQLQALGERLSRWLRHSALPLWAARGIDARNGGFFESIAQDGSTDRSPRRARVAPRQVFVFARALGLGWDGAAATIVRRGIDHFVARYQRSDGLFISLTDADGAPLDLRAHLYDQAFALLGLAAAAEALDARAEFEHRALLLRAAIERRLRAPDRGFFSTDRAPVYRESNPHMHLLEACLAWAAIGADPQWLRWAADLADLGLSHFMRRETGVIGEYFTNSWNPAPGDRDRIEPGHQYEWAWLLLGLPGDLRARFQESALRLIGIAETAGVRNGVAVDALHGDLRIRDAGARLWPQTERLKAGVAGALLTGAAPLWAQATAAAQAVTAYLQTPLPGLWFDRRGADGRFVPDPAPASTFYHLVSAICVLEGALR